MNENSRTGLKAHLVGSVPLDDSEAVFRTVSGSLGPFLDRLPDGETGARINWIRFIQEMLNAHPDLEVDTAAPPIQWVQWDGVLLREIPLVKFKDSVDPANVKFDTGYADAAIQSFTDFDKLQSEGVIPGGVRFQICIATPLASGYNYVSPVARGDYLRVFGAHITGEVEKIAAALPNDRIAIQWDVCQEVLMWENYYGHQPEGFKEQIFSVAGQIGDAVPEPVELGYHLCYDSPKDEHLIQPKDMANMVEMTRGIV
ncbi:MAG: hypothetical protein HQ503_03755, partial [Rhodospirillales bacterium]|nr:hypothetical protein [Rhodospirillales bacterium]